VAAVSFEFVVRLESLCSKRGFSFSTESSAMVKERMAGETVVRVDEVNRLTPIDEDDDDDSGGIGDGKMTVANP
jgi:hypothetical protein